ncbi:MAG: iron ABC transporter permease [Thalassobaculaceae bacterium]|nr:iron ABC transporter permease [Thalassobaculaceae bacterium]
MAATATAASDASDISAAYRRITRRRVGLLLTLCLALAGALVLDVVTGPSALTLGDVIRGLFDPTSLSAGERVILWSVRLPYALMAVVVGASLAVAGVETQTVLNNPLASPYTLGISWAAALGAVAAIVIGIDILPAAIVLPLAAFLSALTAGLAILALAQIFGSRTETIILFGIALVFACTALISLLQFVADAETVQQSVFWMMGSLGRATWEKLTVVALVFAAVMPFTLRGAWSMTLLRAGEEQASSAGLPVHRVRLAAILRASLLTAAAVSFVGTIGFIGLVGPHIARLLLGEDHRFLLPGAALTGALLLSLASIASKLLVAGAIIPVGIVTALVGVPTFVALLVARRRGL